MGEVLLRMLAGVTLGLALVLLLRRPARQAFGAGPAFCLWLLPPLLAFAPWVPQRMASATFATLPAFIVTANAGSAVPHALAAAWPQLLAVVWLAGVAVMLVRLVLTYAGLLRGAHAPPVAWTRMLSDAVPGIELLRVRVHSAGPAVLWALPRAWVLLPDDFAERFANTDTRELVLRHELAHVRRGDAWWSLAMELAFALLWFHPLAWIARPRFRLDQELACDATALRASPARNASYARALLDSVAARPATALIPWLSEPQLKERIAMISHAPLGALRRRAGYAVVAGLLFGGLYVVGAQLPAEAASHPASSASPSVDIGYKSRNPPHYPENAISHGEEGMVMLRVDVNPDGSVARVEIDRAGTTTSSAELQAAAVTAAEHWKFTPGRKDGKAAGGWLTIPVRFSLEPAPQCPQGETYVSEPLLGCVPDNRPTVPSGSAP